MATSPHRSQKEGAYNRIRGLVPGGRLPARRDASRQITAHPDRGSLPPAVDALDPAVAVGASPGRSPGPGVPAYRARRQEPHAARQPRRGGRFAERWHYVNIAPVCYPFRRHAALLFIAAMTGNGQIASIVALHRPPSMTFVQPVERGPEAAVVAVLGR